MNKEKPSVSIVSMNIFIKVLAPEAPKKKRRKKSTQHRLQKFLCSKKKTNSDISGEQGHRECGSYLFAASFIKTFQDLSLNSLLRLNVQCFLMRNSLKTPIKRENPTLLESQTRQLELLILTQPWASEPLTPPSGRNNYCTRRFEGLRTLTPLGQTFGLSNSK